MDRVFHHLRSDFRLSVITLLGLCALVGISPFVFYRFIEGQVTSALVDGTILVCIMLTVGYAHMTQDIRSAGLLMSFFACAGAVAVSIMHGDNGILWVYPATMASFFLTTPRIAVAMTVLTVLALVWQRDAFDSTEQMLAFATTCFTVSACTYIFAHRSDGQRRALETLATVDALTGTRNRRTLEGNIKHVIALASRNRMPYTLVLLDIDHFKHINDTHGHEVGDQVLVQCARTLDSNIRSTDQLYRYGGDEFVVIVVGAGTDHVHRVLANMCSQIRENVASPDGPVTVSLGAAILHPSEDGRQWRARADTALYEAKKAGRDRYVINGDEPSGTRQPPSEIELST